ncbi:MAG: hypothetical protein BAJALOKI2v1_240033 [Promethearchaeota archaeon]|nr:MAG: hypothetical protein BAJALOKI2v1_240033 [Candidatus Lokiarchaeota archaeon]
MPNIISKVVEIDNCRKDELIEALYKKEFWEEISPVTKISVEFISPNVFHSDIVDEIDLVKIPVEMSGELVMEDKGETSSKGRLLELNVRNNKNVKKLEARLRIKSLSDDKTKVGVFVQTLDLESEFMNMLGDASELILRRKITGMLRNLEKFLKTNDLKYFL